MTRWEYLFAETDVVRNGSWIDKWGADGWELVSVVKVNETLDRCYFKRPASLAPSPSTEKR